MNDLGTPLLIKTKLAPPRIGSAPVRRQQILSVLEARPNDALIVILGPAGSGKSTLSTLWRQELVTRGCDVAWYNLGRDDDEAQFLAYVAASFAYIGLSIAADAQQLYNRYGGESFNAFLAVLVNDLQEHSRPVYLFLEDFHYIRSPAIVHFIDRLIVLAPPNFHLVISSRVRPPLNLVPLRAKDQVTEITFSELRFTFDESVRFLRNQRIENLSATQLSTLYQLTDGWAAGLQLAAFSLRKTRDPEKYLARFGGTLTPSKESGLSGYLRECVADHLDAEEVAFLVRTSACRRFNRELCEEITGSARAGELLAKFEAENLFVIPIESDDTVPWYRFHRLFAKFLNEQLLQLPDEDLKKLNQIASHWFTSRSLHAEAFRHAIYARDEGLCVEIIERSARALINSANFVQLLKWFAQVPRESVRERYKLLRCVAWAQVVCGKMDDFEWSIEAIQAHPMASTPEGHFEVQLLKAFKLTRLDDTAPVLELLAPYIGNPPAARPFALMLLCNLAGLALVAAHQFERARDLVHARQRSATREGAIYPSPFVDAVVGLSFLVQGDMWEAKQALLRTMEDARGSSAMGQDPAGYLAGYLAEAYYQLDELEEAEALLSEYADLIDLVGTDSVLFAYRAQARLWHVKGEFDRALRVLERLEDIGRRQGLDRVIACSLAEQVHVELRRKELTAAREALRRLQQIASRYLECRDCAYAEIPFAAAVADAELAAASREPARALTILMPLIDECETQGRHYQAAMLRLRAAIIRGSLAQDAQAREMLRPALAAAAQYRMKRLFLDEGEPAMRLLHELLAHNDLVEEEKAFAESTLRPQASARPADAPPHGQPGAKAQPQAEALSPRELEILELLAKGFTTKTIAKALNVSAGTVKWHLKNLYTKLGAVSHEDAVIKGRSRNLIA